MNIRELAARILKKINLDGRTAKESIREELREIQITDSDRRFLRELVMGSLRFRGRYDYIIKALIDDKPLKDISPYCLEVLRLSLHQLIAMRGTPAFAVLNEGVNAATSLEHEGAGGFVNAILRKYQRLEEPIRFPEFEDDPEGYLTHFMSFPRWLVKRWIERFGHDEALSLCLASNKTPLIPLRLNLKRVSREDIIESLTADGVDMKTGFFRLQNLYITSVQPLDRLTAWKKGWIMVQDEASSLVSLLMQIEKDSLILDLCAAPGGKTIHMAEIARDKASIISIDKSSMRLSMLNENIKRMNYEGISLIKADARNFHLMRMVDRILIDAPCTATGTLSKNPEGKWQKKEDDVEAMSRVQLEILLNAARFLRKDGVMVYSTCSLESEENEDIIKKFISLKPEFIVETAARQIPSPLVTRQGFMRVYPHRHGMEGIFAARLRRRK